MVTGTDVATGTSRPRRPVQVVSSVAQLLALATALAPRRARSPRRVAAPATCSAPAVVAPLPRGAAAILGGVHPASRGPCAAVGAQLRRVPRSRLVRPANSDRMRQRQVLYGTKAFNGLFRSQSDDNYIPYEGIITRVTKIARTRQFTQVSQKIIKDLALSLKPFVELLSITSFTCPTGKRSRANSTAPGSSRCASVSSRFLRTRLLSGVIEFFNAAS